MLKAQDQSIGLGLFNALIVLSQPQRAFCSLNPCPRLRLLAPDTPSRLPISGCLYKSCTSMKSAQKTRNSRFLFIALALLALPELYAQTPQLIQVDPSELSLQNGRVPCTNDAGVISNFGPFIGESNDAVPDTIYLCFGDSVFVNHDEFSIDLSGDPVPSSPAGIGYAFYECPPTVTGPTIQNITTDPCALTTGDVPSTFGLYVDSGNNLSGDSWFWNLGLIQSFFTAGPTPEPQIVWFAPITYDAVDINGLASYDRENDDASNPIGPCVNVSVDQAFAVAYLNEITISDVAAAGCGGSFRVQGGLPELEPGEEYSFQVYLSTDPSITATVLPGPNGHDEVFSFEVPQPGNYVIEIEDGKSCPASQVVTLSSCDAVTFNAPFENHQPGDMFCVDITVEGFVDVLGWQFSMSYDTTVLELTSITTTPMVPDFNLGAFTLPVSAGGGLLNGQFGVLYSSGSGTPWTLTDGEVLFSPCFTVIGQLDECSALQFTNTPVNTVIAVSDGMGSAEESGFIMNDGQICVSNAPFFTSLSQNSVSCPDLADGSITATVAGGMGPYMVSVRRIIPPQAFPPGVVVADDPGMVTFNGLADGLHEVRFIDANGIIILDTIDVGASSSLGLNLIGTSPSCFNAMDGQMQVDVVLDGILVPDPIAAGYNFSWNNTLDTTNIRTGLAGSTFYSVTVTSPSGCQTMGGVSLSEPSRLNVLPVDPDLAVTDASCGGAEDGSITISASGGTTASGDYTFSWEGAPAEVGTMTTLSNLDPGIYNVTVTDDNMCEEVASFTVSADKILSINAVVDDVVCFGDANGEIFATGATTFNIPMGVPDIPYTFQWSLNAPPGTDDDTTTEITGLGPGTYVVTMTDDVGCEVVDSFEVVEPAELIISEIAVTNETCLVGADGQAVLTITGGVMPYTYTWSHDAMLADSIATGLSAGPYSVLVTDANGCTRTGNFDVLSPTPPMITSFPDDFVSCPDATDGSLTITATPGAAPITLYEWADSGGTVFASGADVTTRDNLSPGMYIVTVTDGGNCTSVDTAFVLSPGPVVMDSVRLESPTCPGESTGRITVFPSGGTAPYTYTWSTNPGVPTTLNPLTNLSAGTYFVTITDDNDCTPLIDTIVLEDPPSIVGTFTNITDVSCPGGQTMDGSATVTAAYDDGTTGSYNFLWSNTDTDLGTTVSTVTGLGAGLISVDISDGACGVTIVDTIGAPDPITVNPISEPVSCFGDTDGQATLEAMGGTGPYTYQWIDFGGTGPTQTDLAAGTYTVVVRDDNLCSFQQIVAISEPDPLVLDIDPVQTTPTVQCAGDANAVISVFVSSDNNNQLLPAPYTWSGGVAGPTESIATELPPGTYSVTVEDIKGCTDELTYTIGEPPGITFSVLPIEEPLCFGQTTLVLIDTAFGGSSSSFNDFTFSVNNNGFRIPVTQPGSTFAGQTIVTVFDTVGCSASDTFSVNQPPQILIDLPEVDTIELGDSLTVLNPIISPAGDIYDYLWTPAEFLSSDSVRNPTIYPLESQLYTLAVTNANGCQAFAEIFIEVDANRNVYIPNVFSPNRDGRNEDFRIFACQGVQNVRSVQLFDRWGGIVYSQENIAPNCLDGIRLWDGTKQGKPVNPGVFVYLIEVEFLDGISLLYRGDVTVLR